MTEVTIQMPDVLADLPLDEQETLIRSALYEASRTRILQLKAELAEALAQLDSFEAQQGMSLAQFERERLPELDSFEAHELYNDWTFWHNVAQEKQHLLARYHHLTEP